MCCVDRLKWQPIADIQASHLIPKSPPLLECLPSALVGQIGVIESESDLAHRNLRGESLVFACTDNTAQNPAPSG